MENAPATVSQVNAAINAIVSPAGDKFVCVVNNKVIGTSRYPDYFQFHNNRGDLKALANVSIGKFIYLNGIGKIDHIEEAKKVKSDGTLQKEIVAALRAIAKANKTLRSVSGIVERSSSKAQVLEVAKEHLLEAA